MQVSTESFSSCWDLWGCTHLTEFALEHLKILYWENFIFIIYYVDLDFSGWRPLPLTAKPNCGPRREIFVWEPREDATHLLPVRAKQNQQIQVQQQQNPALPEQPLVCEGKGKIFLTYLMHRASASPMNSTVLPDFMVSLKAVLQWKDDTSHCQTQQNHGFGQEKCKGSNSQKLENMKTKGWVEGKLKCC